MDATFTVGPKQESLSISFENKNDEGEEDIHVTCDDLFELDENGTFHPPSKASIWCFLKDAGLDIDNLEQFNYTVNYMIDEKKLKKMDDDTRYKYMFADIISKAIELVIEKHGNEDDCGVRLGIEADAIYSYLNLDPY